MRPGRSKKPVLDGVNADGGSSSQMSVKDLVDLLHGDIHYCGDLVRDHLSRIQQLMLAIFTIAGVAGTLLYGYHQYVVLLAIPIAGCVVLLMVANITGEAFAVAAHRYFLEQALSKLLRDSLPANLHEFIPPTWDSAGGRIRRRSISFGAIQVVGVLTVVVADVIMIAIAWVKMHAYWWLAPTVAAITLVLILLAVSSYVQAVLSYGETLTALKVQRGLVPSLNPSAPQRRTGGRLLAVFSLLKGGDEGDWESWQIWET
jgi:hypothetical protein